MKFFDDQMKADLKRDFRYAMRDIFLPAFLFTWGLGLGLGSVFLVLSTLWKVFNFF